MNLDVRKTLLELAIPKSLIHIEQFGGSSDEANTEIVPIENAHLVAHLNGNIYELNISKGKTILQVLKDADINAPYSCESGVCATCAAKVKKGKAEMKSCMALDDSEIKNGNILTCQALPTTEEVEIIFK